MMLPRVARSILVPVLALSVLLGGVARAQESAKDAPPASGPKDKKPETDRPEAKKKKGAKKKEKKEKQKGKDRNKDTGKGKGADDPAAGAKPAPGAGGGAGVKPADPSTFKFWADFKVPAPEDVDVIGSSATAAGCDPAGMNEMRLSGSSEFTPAAFQAKILPLMPAGADRIDIDFREEFHGYFGEVKCYWGDAECMPNAGRNLDEAATLAGEEARFRPMTGRSVAVMVKSKTAKSAEPRLVKCDPVRTEKDVVEAAGVRYRRLPGTDEHPLGIEDVDELVKIFAARKPSTWVHVHCKAGKGRRSTGTFLWACLVNAKRLPIEAISKQVIAMGGKDLLTLSETQEPDITWERERKQLIEDFYGYCKANQDGFRTLYSQSRKGGAVPATAAPQP